MKLWTLSMVVMAGVLSARSNGAQVFRVDAAKSSLSFSVKNFLVMTVPGAFKKFSGQVEVAEKSNLYSLKGSVEIDSIDTENEKRDTHLRSPDYFDTARFPRMEYAGGVEVTADNTAVATGQLTIRGITLPLRLEGTKLPMTSVNEIGFELEGELDRKKFGLTAGPSMADTVRLKVILIATEGT